MTDEDWELIHSYTRAQAIADSVLIAAPEYLCRDAGFTIPVALTNAAWQDCVAWDDSDTQRTGMPQDETGRLWDVLHMTTYAIRGTRKDQDRVTVQLYRVPRDASAHEAVLVELVAHIGPGDSGEPVFTMMLPGED